MKIGIMGGTFNPIHNGHLLLASAAKKAACLDEVWFMPSGLPAHKSNKELLPAKERLAMVKLAITGISGFDASSFEIERPGFTYTADTMEALSKEYPKHEFYFIIGGDSLMKFHHWVKPELISRHTTLLAAGRDNFSKKELLQQAENLYSLFGTRVRLIDMPPYPVSSNHIRFCIKNKKAEDIREFLPENVFEHILKNEFYR